MSEWSPDDLPNMETWTAVVTGANSGIGFETTRLLVAHGARVVMACRSVDRGRRAADQLRKESPPGELVVEELDLASLDSITAFAEGLRSEEPAIELLVNNAGVMATPYRTTEDGFELQFGVNHLGHFALTGQVLELVETGNWESRIVTVSSRAHETGTIDFEDLNHEQSYSKWGAYGQSKLANLLFAFELQRRLTAADAAAISLAAHPGWAATELQQKGPEMAGNSLRKRLMAVVNGLLAQPAEQGAWPVLYAATHEALSGGEYIGPTGLLEMRGAPGVSEPSEAARNVETARRLWDSSAELTGVSYDLPSPSGG